MKQQNKIGYTFLIISFSIVLILMFKYFQFLKQPDFIQRQHGSFISYPGIGGILSILTITFAFYLIINIWKISKEEQLLKIGKENEVKDLKKLLAEGLLTDKEVEEKFGILIEEFRQKMNENSKNEQLLKKEELIKNLTRLKENGLLTDLEFENKKEQILSENKS